MHKDKEQIETESDLVGKTIAKVDGRDIVFTDGSSIYVESWIEYGHTSVVKLDYTRNA